MDLICVRGAVYFTPGLRVLMRVCWRDHFNLVVCALRRTPCGPRRRRRRQKMILLYVCTQSSCGWMYSVLWLMRPAATRQKRALLEGTLGDNCRLARELNDARPALSGNTHTLQGIIPSSPA